MILLAIAMLAPSADAPPTDALPDPLPRQQLPARGCAAYLFSRGDKPVFVSVATADPAQLRLSLGGVVTDVARTGQRQAGGFGFAGVTEYAGGGMHVVLDMTIATRADLKDGAAIGPATLRIDRAGQDGVVLPVAGIIGCAP